LAENIKTIRLLAVSREQAVLRLLWSMEESNGWRLQIAASGWDAMEQLQSGGEPDLLMLDIPRSDSDSLHLLRWLRRLRRDLPVIVLCHSQDTAIGKEASRIGAEEVLVRPLDERQLESAVRRQFRSAEIPATNLLAIDEADIISENVEQLGPDCCFISAAPIMQKLRAQCALLAQIDVPVLIVGESGAGKYTVASLIHKLSVRSGFKLQVVNCAEMPEALLEAELFGGARDSNGGGTGRQGKFAAGEKGIVFLDEIAAMSRKLQSRLLPILQQHEVRETSGPDAIAGHVRILAASSDNLEQALAEKRLQEDLYYRLSAFTVHVPALRQRKAEIDILLRYFMHKLAKRYNLPPRGFSAPLLDACQRYPWPGNLKELEALVKRLLVAGDEELSLKGMSFESTDSSGNASATRVMKAPVPLPAERIAGGKQNQPESLKSLIQGIKSEAEQSAIGDALTRTGWNRKAAARLLRVSYRTLLYKIEQYQMRAPEPFLSPLPAGEFSLFGTEVKGKGR
jgi:two-component system, NtrC family, response regulator AtoC